MSSCQTADGYLWLATYGGLARFDGVRFKALTVENSPELASDRFTSVFEDAQKNLWVGDEHGELERYRDGKFESFPVHEIGESRQIVAINADENGDIWILNADGTVIRVRDGTTSALPNSIGAAAMTRDTRGRLWVASGGRLGLVRDGALVPLSGTNGFSDGYVQGVCASRQGGLWVAVDNHIRRWRDGEWLEEAGMNPCVTTITAMLELKNGDLALGAVDSGLNILSTNHAPVHLNNADGFPHNWIRSLCEDREGTLWVGAGNAGLVALRPAQVETFLPPDHWLGRGGALSVTATHDGAVWATTEGAGIYRFLNGEWSHFTETNGLANTFVWSVAEDVYSNLWVGTWGGGMFVLKNGCFTNAAGLENLKLPMPALLHGRNGVTWIGTGAGLLRVENGATQFYGEKSGLRLCDVRCIAEAPDGTVWFGMVGGGLGRLQNGIVKQFTKADGLANDFVQSLHIGADGCIWLGTAGGGLARLKDGRFSKISAADGLPNDFIGSIVDDGRGFLWIGSRGGIFCAPEKSFADCADGKGPLTDCRTYGLAEGMPTIECAAGLQPAAAHTADGRIWFATTKALVAVDPNAPLPPRQPAPAKIEELSVNGQVLPSLAGDDPIKLPPGSQRFQFRYTGLSFVAPEDLHFQTRLDGWDKDWMDAGNMRVAEYNYLPPGGYRFHVRAANRAGGWDAPEAMLEFTVRPHFWQTWWCRFATILVTTVAVVSFVWWLSRRRLRRRLEAAQRAQTIERERTRIAKDIHDHLGANLTRISLLSQSAHGDLQNPTLAAAQLDRIYDTARDLTRAMDEIVWAVNPQHDTLDSLASYLGNFAQEYLVPLGVRCRLDVPLHLPHLPISAETRHNIYLAVKEALNNVVKHSGATEVFVDVVTGSEDFTLIIRDNGQGFDPANVRPKSGRGNGLKNMSQRLEKIGGRCTIKSSQGSGTEIKFLVRAAAAAKIAN